MVVSKGSKKMKEWQIATGRISSKLGLLYLPLQPAHLEMFPTTKCSLNGRCSVAGVVMLEGETITLQSPPATIGLLTFVTVG